MIVPPAPNFTVPPPESAARRAESVRFVMVPAPEAEKTNVNSNDRRPTIHGLIEKGEDLVRIRFKLLKLPFAIPC
jgi:hypothetical protein